MEKNPKPFSPHSLSHLSCPPWLQGNHLPFYPSQGIASGQGKFKCGWGTCGANTSPLRSYTKGSTDFGVGCCGFAPLELWAHSWECKKLFEMPLCFFPPEFISSSSIWWQCCHGSVGLSLITNSLESPRLCLTHSCTVRGSADCAAACDFRSSDTLNLTLLLWTIWSL